MAIINATDEEFEEQVIEESKKIPVLVDFWAPWCAPCLMLGPILEKLANSAKYKNKLILAKLNIEENPKKASEYRIMSIPSVKLFREEEVFNEFTGFMQEKEIEQWLDKNLK